MITITETPHLLPATTWKALDRADLIAKCYATHEQNRLGTTIYEATTPRELINSYAGINMPGATADELHAEAVAFGMVIGPDVLDAMMAHGPDVQLVRADYLAGEGRYFSPGNHAITEYDACVAYLGHDLRSIDVVEE